jgi:hypothetical protein
MVRKFNIQINLTNKRIYTFVAIIVIFAGIGVYAFGGLSPSTVGHSAGELDLSGGVSGDAIFNGNVGIGTSTPAASLDVVGDILASDIAATSFLGDGSQLTNIEVRVTGQAACDSTNDGLLRYRSDVCAGDDLKGSFFDICVKKGSNTYGWKTVDLGITSWVDMVCDTDGCPVGQNYYQCRGGQFPEPGCYSFMPFGCFFEEQSCGGGRSVCP